MSRCFPFLPPGHERKYVVEKETLIESIKLQREQELAKKERKKEKKREKREKKKEKKVKTSKEKNYDSHEKWLKDEGCDADYRGGDYQKSREDENENLEKSSLTEEHGQPASVLNLCDSSDSTQNSSRKRKHNFLSDGNHKQSTVLRIRLPLLKPKVLESQSSEEQYCSTSGRVEIIAHNKGGVAPNLSKELLCSTSKRVEIPAQDVAEPAAKPSSLGSGSPDKDVQLRDLIENWVPLPNQIESTDIDDQEWLFDASHKHEAKRHKDSNGSSRHNCSKVGDGATNGSFSCWPRACYLPEANIYALPYTVPY